MNNNIQEPYCSFEVSKLLKEKGLDVDILTMYHTGFDSTGTHDINGIPTTIENKHELKNYPNLIKRPTHALAIEWIRVNFGWFIHLSYVCWPHLEDHAYTPHIAKELSDNGSSDARRIMLRNYKTPQEATEAALLYTLQNLIP